MSSHGNYTNKTHLRTMLFAIVLLGLPGNGVAASRPPEKEETLDFPGAKVTVAYGINAAGDVVGTYVDASGISHGFLLSEGEYTTIDPPGAVSTEARGINARGEIVGDYVASDHKIHGFRFGREGFTNIDVPDHMNTIAVKISSKGVIVGCFHDTDTMGTMHGFVRHGETITRNETPASMNNGITLRGDVAGFYTDLMSMTTHAYIISKGETTQFDYPGSPATRAWDLNPRGEAVGFYLDKSTGTLRGFAYRKGKFRAIDITGAKSTRPFGINRQGEIVGAYVDQSGATHGFLLTKDDGEDE